MVPDETHQDSFEYELLPMNQRSLLFFDLDGTLGDPKVGITTCMQYALGKLGRPVPEQDELTWCIGPPLRDNLKRLLSTDDPVLIEEAVKTYRERYNAVGMFEYRHYDGVEEMLQQLRSAGHKLCVVSSKATPYLKPILEHLGLYAYFSRAYGPDMTGRLDNKVELLASVLKRLGAEPSHSIMIGDREQDIMAGRHNGTMTIAVTWGYGSADEIRQANPDHICNSPAQVVATCSIG
jgi:phosphoglycolate phosphatase